jgi:hypothetical protein
MNVPKRATTSGGDRDGYLITDKTPTPAELHHRRDLLAKFPLKKSFK